MAAGDAGARSIAAAPGPADVGIVAAMPMEVQALLSKFREVRRYRGPGHKVIEGECGGKVVAMIVSGPGRKAARRGAQLLLDGHRPRWIISAGFGGALDPALRRNDVVLPGEVIDEDGGRFAIDVTVPADSGGDRLGTGRLVTVDRIILTAAEKAELRDRHGADLVDMETSAIAALCSERAVRFLSLRIISDEAGVDLPREILGILGPSGGYRLGAAVGAIWRRPSSLVDLLGLREHALQCADRLADVLPGAIARLP